jgi:predicted lipoprotein
MYTSILGLALATSFAAANELAPTWHHDYRQARDLGEKEHKPVVVVIGSGKSPWANLSKVAGEDSKINSTLRSNYVCLFVDTDTPEGQRLAKLFGIDQGLVISDKTGEVQAFRHSGELTAAQVAQALAAHANGEVAKPVFTPTSYPSFGGNCPSCRRGW